MREVVEHGRGAFVEQLPCLRQNDVGIGAAAAEIIRIAAKLAANVGVKLDLHVVFIADVLYQRVGEGAAEIVELSLGLGSALREAQPARDAVCKGDSACVCKVVVPA